MGKKRVLLLINELSRQGAEAKERALSALQERGHEVIAPSVSHATEFSRVIARHAGKVDVVAVGGGDGSLRCALKGLIESRLPMAVLPLGTANNLARNIGVPEDIDAACEIIGGDSSRSIDVAEVNGVYFLNVVGIGLSSRVNREVPRELKKRWGVFAYAATALKEYRRLRSFKARLRLVQADGREIEVIARHVLQMTICNGRHFGSGLTIQPEATIDDGLLDLAIMESVGLWRGFKILKELVRGDGARAEGLQRYYGLQLSIETPKPLPIDVDGDVLATTPATFRIHKNALQVLAPPVTVEKNERTATETTRSPNPELEPRPVEL